MNLKYKIFKLKQRLYKNFNTNDLKVGTKVKWYKGTSIITKVLTTHCISKVNNGQVEIVPKTSYMLNTNYNFSDEKDIIFKEDILKVINY